MPVVAHSVCGRLRELLLQGRLCSQLGQRRLCDSVRLPQRARHLHSQSSVTTLCALHRGRERGGWATSTGIPALRASATASPAPSRGRIRVRPLPSRQYSLASGGSSATPDGAAGVFAFMSLYRTAPAPPGRASATCFGSSPASASERSMTAERSSPARGSVAAQRAAEKKLPFRKTSEARRAAVPKMPPPPPAPPALPRSSSCSSRCPSSQSSESGSIDPPGSGVAQIRRCSAP